MLMRVAKPGFDALHEGNKKLLIWALSRKQDFHCTCENNFFDVKGNHEYKDRNSEQKRPRYFESNEPRNFDNRRPRYFDNRRPRNFDNRQPRNYGYRIPNNGFRERRPYNDLFSRLVEKPEFKVEDLVAKNSQFYNPHENVINRSEDEIKKYHAEHEIQIFGNLGNTCPPPIFSFEELNLSSKTMDVIRQLGYTQPTPIQSVTWPIALSGSNMVGNAQTGSGKTLAFALPGLIHVKNQPPRGGSDGPVALVIAPTRELAQQIERVLIPFQECFDLRVGCTFGGVPKYRQESIVQRSDICVATPGRIMDFLVEGVTNLRRVTYFVLDEADRLLDMGFEPQIRAIMGQMRSDSQILMWSATWPKDVAALSSDFLKDHIGVKFGSSELTVNSDITQHIHVCHGNEKLDLFLKLLNQIKEDRESKTLVFCQTKRGVDFLSNLLRRKTYRVGSLHGDMTQQRRDNTMRLFREGKVDILIGTAVVARGLDVNDIKYVVNYDFPQGMEDYVHVIGRTGRSGNKGTAHSFFTANDEPFARGLIAFLNQCKQEINPELEEMTKKRISFRSPPVRGRPEF